MIKASFMATDAIERVAIHLIQKFEKETGNTILNNPFGEKLNLDDVLSFMTYNKTLEQMVSGCLSDFVYTSDCGLSENVLGKCDLKNRVIYIYDRLNHKGRENFTGAHEIGHFMLHYPIFYREYCQSMSMFDSPDMAIICKRDSIEGRKTNDTNVDSLEWQANYFAGCLLMPEQVVKNLYNLFEELISKHTYKKGFVNELNLVLNDHDLIGFVALRCEVSRQAAEIRLKNLKMLNTRYLRPIDRARVEAISYTNNLKINGF